MALDYLLSVTDEEGRTIQLKASVCNKLKQLAFLFILEKITQGKANIGNGHVLSGFGNHIEISLIWSSCQPARSSHGAHGTVLFL